MTDLLHTSIQLGIKNLYVGSPIKVPYGGRAMRERRGHESYKRGLFISISKTGRMFSFLHVPSGRTLRRDIDLLEHETAPKQIQKIYNWARKNLRFVQEKVINNNPHLQ